MAFLSHRCTSCGHPEYWAQEATRAGSAPRGFVVDGKPFNHPLLARVWCKQCKTCAPDDNGTGGCVYRDGYEVEQWNTDGTPVVGLFKPGEEVTGAKASAGKTYACCCDRCWSVYRSTQRDAPAGFYN